IRALEGVEIDLADRAVVRSNLWLQSTRQIHLGEALENLLAIPVIRRFVIEDEHEARKPEQRGGAQMIEMRNAIHRNFEWDRDLLLHFFGGPARPLRDHLDIVIGDIGIRFDRQIMEGNRTPHEQQQRDEHNQESIVQREIDQRVNHVFSRLSYCSDVFCISRALATTLSPGLTPAVTIWIFFDALAGSGMMAPPVTSTRLKLLPPAGS